MNKTELWQRYCTYLCTSPKWVSPGTSSHESDDRLFPMRMEKNVGGLLRTMAREDPLGAGAEICAVALPRVRFCSWVVPPGNQSKV